MHDPEAAMFVMFIAVMQAIMENPGNDQFSNYVI